MSFRQPYRRDTGNRSNATNSRKKEQQRIDDAIIARALKIIASRMNVPKVTVKDLIDKGLLTLKPDTITLIELVTLAREMGLPWIAIDARGTPWIYDSEPTPYTYETWMFNGNKCQKINKKFNLTCDWKQAIIEVSKIKETGP